MPVPSSMSMLMSLSTAWSNVPVPPQMMQNLLLEVGQTVHLKNVSLPKGEFVKLQVGGLRCVWWGELGGWLIGVLRL